MGKRILIIKPSSFGDIVHLFPALKMIRKNFPDAEADFVVNPEFAGVLEFSPLPIRRKIIFERRKLSSVRTFPGEILHLIREIRQQKYDITIDFQGLLRSGLLTFISRADRKAGFSSPREKSAALFYNQKYPVPRCHAVKRCGLLAAQALQIKDFTLKNGDLPENPAGKAELSSLPEHFIALLPGARWESKRFPPGFFTALINAIRSKTGKKNAFVVCGTAQEAGLAEKIGGDAIDFAGKTSVAGLFELLRRSDAVIGNDSGPLHVAAALNVPVFGFYGSTDPELTGPWGENCRTFQAETDCIGCLKRICPDGSYRCWDLDVDKIALEIVKILKGDGI